MSLLILREQLEKELDDLNELAVIMYPHEEPLYFIVKGKMQSLVKTIGRINELLRRKNA
jgi:hypothetical protein